jgi:hypothetical protein
MSQLVISDLPQNQELDRAARTAICGGISFGWIRPFVEPVASTPSAMNFFNVTNNFFDIDVVEQNPTNVFVDNSGSSSGSIVNNITAMPILAASPTLFSSGN